MAKGRSFRPRSTPQTNEKRRAQGEEIPWEFQTPELLELMAGTPEEAAEALSTLTAEEEDRYGPDERVPTPIRPRTVSSPRMTEGPRPRLDTSDPALVARAAEVAGRVRIADVARTAALQERDKLVADLRAAGWGYDRIARALGITKSRAQQLCR